MYNFDYSLKTNVLFGENRIQELPQVLSALGKKVLVVYGGNSSKKLGILDTLYKLLNNFELYELSGVKPNPKVNLVNVGARLCKEKGIDVILGIGGGSVLDTCKVISVAAFYKGDAWDLVTQKAQVTNALPLVGILTLAASGSELGCGAVISNPQTNEKLGLDHPLMQFHTMIMDPRYTVTVPKLHTAAGSIDIFSHLLEQYLTSEDTLLSNLLCESVMKTVIHYAPMALKEPNDLEARGQLMWAASLANNGILSLGSQPYAFSCHGIEHEISAYHDVIHGIGLAIVTPRWMEYILNEHTVHKFARYAKEVFGIEGSNEKEMAKKAIQATTDFFASLKVPMHLSELGITDEHFDEIARQAVSNGYLEYAWQPLNEEDVKAILKVCL